MRGCPVKCLGRLPGILGLRAPVTVEDAIPSDGGLRPLHHVELLAPLGREARTWVVLRRGVRFVVRRWIVVSTRS